MNPCRLNKQKGHFSNIIKLIFTVLGGLSLWLILKINLVGFILQEKVTPKNLTLVKTLH